VSRQLVADYGRGYSEKNLRRMIQLAVAFPDEEIVVTLSRQLSWSHFSALLPLNRPFQREFYAEMARIEGWSCVLCAHASIPCFMSVPRCRNSQKRSSGELAMLRSKGDLAPALLLKDPYVLDFLGAE
jgi:hypothetical protein